MGVLNVTPDSFSDGGRHASVSAALAHARTMVEEGAAIIDVGGESTRPGAVAVGEAEELDRVIPVIDALKREFDCVISVDTAKAAVMRAACAAGAELVNDVNALRGEGALAAVRETGAAACLMHRQGEPRTMQQAPQYTDVVAEVKQFLRQRLEACAAAGIPRDRLLVDPGFGFGKSLEHNLALLAALGEFTQLGAPLLAGLSRKTMLGTLTGRDTGDRVHAGLAAAVLAAWQGAAVIRTHDVRATMDALKVTAAARAARRT